MTFNPNDAPNGVTDEVLDKPAHPTDVPANNTSHQLKTHHPSRPRTLVPTPAAQSLANQNATIEGELRTGGQGS